MSLRKNGVENFKIRKGIKSGFQTRAKPEKVSRNFSLFFFFFFPFLSPHPLLSPICCSSSVQSPIGFFPATSARRRDASTRFTPRRHRTCLEAAQTTQNSLEPLASRAEFSARARYSSHPVASPTLLQLQSSSRSCSLARDAPEFA